MYSYPIQRKPTPSALWHDTYFTKLVDLYKKDERAYQAYMTQILKELKVVSVDGRGDAGEITIVSILDLLDVYSQNLDECFRQMSHRITLIAEYYQVIKMGEIFDSTGCMIGVDSFKFNWSEK